MAVKSKPVAVKLKLNPITRSSLVQLSAADANIGCETFECPFMDSESGLNTKTDFVYF